MSVIHKIITGLDMVSNEIKNVGKITMIDEVTGDEYYVSIRNGELTIRACELRKHRDNQIGEILDKSE